MQLARCLLFVGMLFFLSLASGALAAPDLAVTGVTVTPAGSLAGSEATLTLSLQNTGDVAATNFTVKVWLRRDTEPMGNERNGRVVFEDAVAQASVPADEVFNPGAAQDFSVMISFKSGTLPGSYGMLIGNSPGTWGPDWMITAGHTDSYFYAKGEIALIAHAVDPLDGTWHNLCLVVSGATAHCYLDGAEFGTFSAGGGGSSGDIVFADDPNIDWQFVGSLSKASYWNRALSAAEVANLAIGATQLSGDENGLVAYWPMDDGEGNSLREVVGNREATISGGYRWVAEESSADIEVALKTLDAGRSVTLSYSFNLPSACGEQTVWVIANAAGAIEEADETNNTAQAIYTVADTEDPTITCPPDVTANTGSGQCYATAIDQGTPVFSDNCQGATVTNDAPTEFPLGVSVVTWVVTDTSGHAATCVQTVTVEDREPPVIVACSLAVTVGTDAGQCYATDVALSEPEFSDNCEGASTTNDAPASFSLGETVVTWTVTDAVGNTATCTQIVTAQDNEAPVITCENMAVVTDPGQCTAENVTLVQPSVSDNCEINELTNDAPPAFPVGSTVVTWTATDASGNTATCEQIVIVEDAEPPVITCLDNLTVAADAGSCTASLVDLGTPTAWDNCEVVELFSDAPTSFSVGDTAVTWTAIDFSGNSATCTQIVTVQDTEPPTITCPPDVTAPQGYVDLGYPTYTDNCGFADVTNNAPAEFLRGTTEVRWTATDASGNTVTCTQTVKVFAVENMRVEATWTEDEVPHSVSGEVSLNNPAPSPLRVRAGDTLTLTAASPVEVELYAGNLVWSTEPQAVGTFTSATGTSTTFHVHPLWTGTVQMRVSLSNSSLTMPVTFVGVGAVSWPLDGSLTVAASPTGDFPEGEPHWQVWCTDPNGEFTETNPWEASGADVSPPQMLGGATVFNVRCGSSSLTQQRGCDGAPLDSLWVKDWNGNDEATITPSQVLGSVLTSVGNTLTLVAKADRACIGHEITWTMQKPEGSMANFSTTTGWQVTFENIDLPGIYTLTAHSYDATPPLPDEDSTLSVVVDAYEIKVQMHSISVDGVHPFIALGEVHTLTVTGLPVHFDLAFLPEGVWSPPGPGNNHVQVAALGGQFADVVSFDSAASRDEVRTANAKGVSPGKGRLTMWSNRRYGPLIYWNIKLENGSTDTTTVVRVELKSVIFTSDHGVLRENAQDLFSSTGPLYAPRGYHKTPYCSNPITHTKGEKLRANVCVKVEPSRVNFELIGDGSMGALNFRKIDLESTGEDQVIPNVEADDRLPDEIATIDQQQVLWKAKFGTETIEIETSGPHKVFVLWDKPKGFAPATKKRVEWVCENAAGAKTLREIADKIHQALRADPPNDGTGGKHVRDWRLLDGGAFRGYCDEQADLMVFALEMIGHTGTSHRLHASRDGTNLRSPNWEMDAQGKTWYLLFDFDPYDRPDNHFEGYVEVDVGGGTKHYYAVWPSIDADSECALLRKLGPDAPNPPNAKQVRARFYRDRFGGAIIAQDLNPIDYPQCP